MAEKRYVRALTIAGSDSGGGAGIQADLKTFSALGCYGMSVVTSVTAQNTIGVQGIYDLHPEAIEQQINSIINDIGVDVIKIGMLHRSEIIDKVSSSLYSLNKSIPIIVDPVMVSKSGHNLLNEEAIGSLREKIFPLSTVITPNIPEASSLLERNVSSIKEMEQAARELSDSFETSVVIKGGHMEEIPMSNDCLWEYGNQRAYWFESLRINTKNTHGTGCTFSAAIAAHLGQGKSIQAAVQLGKEYLHNAIVIGSKYTLGNGHGPVHHFHNLWNQ